MRSSVLALAALMTVAGCTPAPGVAPSSSEHGHATRSTAACRSEGPPLGALPPAVPSWCLALGAGIDTAIQSTNTWLDEFKSGASNVRLAASYRVFDSPRARASTVVRTRHFAHNGHWMVDVEGEGSPLGVYEGSAADFHLGPNNGGAMMRPEKGFRFVDGRLVVEVDVAAGMDVYGDRIWPEIVVTTADAPTTTETNGWYAAGLFGGHPAVGCGLPADRHADCRVYDDEKITASLTSYSSAGAKLAFGGAPTSPALDAAWRRCGATTPDEQCRDRFRMVFERDALTLFVNGVRYMEHRGLPVDAQLPAELLDSTVYVYFGSWAYLTEPAIARVHWGRIAINP